MARFAPLSRKNGKKNECNNQIQGKICPKKRVEITLADVSPGMSAKIIGFCDKLPKERCSHLRAYGLVPGNMIKVLQHSPVTVVQIDHTELAMEMELACEIKVEDDLYLFSN
jgi:Fe2+ transport system protein FeoA